MMDRMLARDRIGFILVGLGAIAFALTPWIGGNYLVRFATSTCLFITMALSWNFIGGYARYPSFATAAFFGLGAYAGAIAQTRGLAMPGAWLFAAVFTAMFAACLGFGLLGLGGHYLVVGVFLMVE